MSDSTRSQEPRDGSAGTEAGGQVVDTIKAASVDLKEGVQNVVGTVQKITTTGTEAGDAVEIDAAREVPSMGESLSEGSSMALGGAMGVTSGITGTIKGAQELGEGKTWDGAVDVGGGITNTAAGFASMTGKAVKVTLPVTEKATFLGEVAGPVAGGVQAITSGKDVVEDYSGAVDASDAKKREDVAKTVLGTMMAVSPFLPPPADAVAFTVGAVGSLALVAYDNRGLVGIH